MAVRVLPVAGTWSYDGDVSPDEWYHPCSHLFEFFRFQQIDHASPDEPFVWDGEVDGGLRWPTARTKHLIWRAAADNLAYRLRRMPLYDRNLVAHSHGGAVAVYAANRVQINRLVTVAMPVRKDMLDAYRGVSVLVGWRHVAHLGFWGDRMQAFGAMLDGAWGVERRVLLPTVQNIQIPGIGHSGLLNDPSKFPHWIESGLIPFLKGAV